MSDNDGRSRRIQFGVFEVDLRTGELRKQGLKIKLHGQPFQVLAMLLERPGELVTREEIREKLWPQDTFIDFEHSVNSSIKRLREALGDAAATPRFIETLPRHGYRFIAQVETLPYNHTSEANAEAETAFDSESPAPGTGRAAGLREAAVMLARPPAKHRQRDIAVTAGARRSPLPRRWVAAMMVGLAVALVAIIIGLNVFRLRDRLLLHTAPVPRIASIAVLPLENLSHDPEQEYFADGMTEELITNLGKIGALRVISRTSVMRYKGTRKPLPEIANELNVDALVEGTVLRSGNRVRVTVNLLHARTDRHLWAETYERDLHDVLSLQDEVARAIAEEIEIRVTPQEEARLSGSPAVSPEAFRFYLQARYHSYKRTLPGFEKSIQLFQQALALDPNYASAYAGLAETYGLLPFYGGASSKESFPKAKAAALKAVELDGSLAEAHAALGFVLFYGDWDWAAAERELKRAIELKPSYVTSHHWYAEYLSAMGRQDEAIAEIKRAQELDPLSPLLFAIGAEVCVLARRYDEVIEQSQKALELDSNYALAHGNLADGFLGKGMNKEAAAEYIKADQIWGMTNSSRLALGYALTGKKAEALEILRRLRKTPGQPGLTSIMEALLCLNGALCDKREVLDWLEKAYEEHEVFAPFWNVHPAFDPLRSHPRFQDLLRRMNFPP